MKLSRNGQIVLSALFVASLVLGGAGFAQAKATQIAYQEQTKQIKLYKDELNEVQGQLQEYTKYKVMYECVDVERNQLKAQVEELSKWKALGQFVITFYWPGEDQYGSLTSTGVTAVEGKTIAVDPTAIPYGSTILINGNEYIAEDCGGAIKGNKIDVFVENPKMEKQVTEVYLKRRN